jgi:peptide/nickel transport system substrate-binding protein
VHVVGIEGLVPARLEDVEETLSMMNLPDTPFEPSGEESPHSSDRLFPRRALFGSVFSGITALALAGSLVNRLRGSTSRKVQVSDPQTGFPDESATGSGSPTPGVATPIASPEASPAASPVASIFGNIEVVRGDVHEYSGTPRDDDLLTLFVQGERENLDFSPAAFAQDVQIMVSYLDPLVRIDDVTMEPIPGLAADWEWGEGNQTVTFMLREGVRWHDGDPLHARDVVFSFMVYRDDVNSAVRNIFTPMEFAEDLDSRTVKVTLSAPDGNWILNAASQLIFQRKQYNGHWTSRPEGQRTLSGFDWDSESPVGTGPWKVGRHRSVGIEFERNDDYWDAPPSFERMNLKFSTDQQERLARWNEGEADLIWPLSTGDIDSVTNTPAVLYVSSGASVMFAAFNFENLGRPSAPQLLSDSRIRRALTLAVDRDRYATDLFYGFIRQNSAGTVAQPWANAVDVKSPRRDLAAARKLLSEAGFAAAGSAGGLADPTGSPFSLSGIVREDANPMLIRLLDGLIKDFEGLGATLNVRVLPPDEFFDSWTANRDYDLIAYSYALYPGFTDYDLYGSNWDIRINPQGWNPGGYHNEDVDSLIKKILISPNLTSQRTLLERLQQTVNDDLFGLWFGFPDDLVLARKDVRGFQPNKYLPTWNTRLLWRDEGSAPEETT